MRYRGAKGYALKNVSLDAEPGEVVGVLGPTGAGKSSFLLTLNSLMPRYIYGDVEGEIEVDDLNVKDYDTPEMAQHIGIVLPDPALSIVCITVEDDICFGPQCLGLPLEEIRKRLSDSLHAVRLDGFEKRTTKTLSGGEQQSLCIGGALAMRPPIMALDEPISMLDPIGKANALSVIRSLNKDFGITILITESGGDIDYIAPICDRLYVFHDGEVLTSGPTRDVVAQVDVLAKARIRSVQITQLASEFKNLTDTPIPVSFDEGVDFFKGLFEKKRLNAKKLRQREKQITKKRDPIIHCKNVHQIFPGLVPVHALQGIDLDIYPGEMVGLIGQNGSGKTTLSYHLVGLIKPSNPDAEVIVHGIDAAKRPVDEVIKHINYSFQNPDNQLFSDSVWDEVTYALELQDLPEEEVERRATEVLKLYGMEDMKDDFILYLTKDKKTFLASASLLALDPDVLIVDEPTTGLDYDRGIEVMKILTELNRKGLTVIVITHNMQLVAEYCSRVVVLRRGKVMMDGTPREIFSQPDVLKETWLEPPQVTRLGQSLGDYGLPSDLLSNEEFLSAISVVKGGR
jgi:energy-coupling factor transport system ATP-binding protein